MVFLVNFGRVVFAPLLEPLAADFGVTVGSLGVVASAAWVGSALPRVPTGWLLTKTTRARVVAGAGGVLFTAALLTAFAPTIPLLTVGAFLMGLASGAYFIAANPLVSELFPSMVGRMLGIHGMASQLAAAGAAVIVTVILFVGDWQLTFLVVAVAAALATAGFVVAARQATLPDAGTQDRDLLGATRAQWHIVATGIVVVGTVGFVWNGLFNFYPTYMRVKGLEPATADLMLSVLFGAGVPAFLVTARLADRIPNVPLLLGVVVAFATSLLLLTVTTGLWPLVAVTALVGYVIHAMFPAADTYLLASLPDHHRASAYTAYSAVAMLVQAGGSAVVGWLADSGVAFDALFGVAGGALVVVFLCLVGLHATDRLPAGRVPT
ncbi:MFS transporter [Halorarius litoreus]|uniref:MFS transporter n=1 Tax=Halorarius litoreus TaxID=2962676 RepID=UPI003D9C8A8C